MRILYISNSLSNKCYKEINESMENNISWQQQKFNKLVMKGFIENECEVVAISVPPISRNNFKRFTVKLADDLEDGIKYVYPSIINFPFLKNFFLKLQISQLIKQYKTKDTFIFCDALKDRISIFAYKTGKKYGIKTCALYTDVPGIGAKKVKDLKNKINVFNSLKNARKYDCYAILTEKMNDIVNPYQKDFVLTECICDSMPKVKTTIATPKKIIYAGSLKTEYGIANLVDGFIRSNLNNYQLRIYGSGDYSNELTRITKEHKNIIYLGSVSNEIVMQDISDAFLIVNPRPNIGEYVKYSFPSKNMEAMSSGTPLLGVRLQGIPNEYFNYMYTIDDNNPDSICNALIKISTKQDNDQISFGKKAQMFVTHKKSGFVQTRKILDMMKGLMR